MCTFCPPGGTPPGGVSRGAKVHPILDPSWGGHLANIMYKWSGGQPILGSPDPDFGSDFRPILAPGRRAGPGGGFSGISGFPEFPPGRDPAPDPPSRGGVAGGVAWDRIWQGALGPIITPPQARLLLSQFALATVMSPKHSIAVAT